MPARGEQMVEETKIERLIRDTITARLSGVKVVSVEVSDDVDYSGDKVLTVRVIYDASKKLDGAKLAGVLRSLRPRLSEELSEDRFPIMSFVAATEARREHAGAA